MASERLGHATVAMTLDRYSHVSDSLRREAALAVQALLEGAPEPDRVSNRVSNAPPELPQDSILISKSELAGGPGREGRIRTADLTVPNRAL